MPEKTFPYFLELLKSYQHPNGGFPYHAGEEARPDATAWAVIAISAWAFDEKSCSRARAYLVSQQKTDGRISISPNHPDASWPTPFAILAFQGSSDYHQTQSLAIEYLLGLTGEHFVNPASSIMGHDTSIKGWPWIFRTHSWVIPTAMAIISLQISGITNHPRISEGIALLLDRQLPQGGWNSGNTMVFGKILLPLPECTGIALHGLAGNTTFARIEKSFTYILEQLPSLWTPISLGWALLGLGAWGFKPVNTEQLVEACLRRQERYGAYPLPSLALLLCAAKASEGLDSLFRSAPKETISPS